MTPPFRLDLSAALLLAPAAVGLALAAACSRPSDPLVPYAGPATTCGREADTKACDGGWAFECSYDTARNRCLWRTSGAPCRGEPEARKALASGREGMRGAGVVTAPAVKRREPLPTPLHDGLTKP